MSTLSFILVTHSEYGDTFAFDEFERPQVKPFMRDVQPRQFFSRDGEAGEVGREWDSREFTFQIRWV